MIECQALQDCVGVEDCNGAAATVKSEAGVIETSLETITPQLLSWVIMTIVQMLVRIFASFADLMRMPGQILNCNCQQHASD